MELTIALNRYDRHVPFFNGTVKPPDGVTLKPLDGETESAEQLIGLLPHSAFRARA